MNVLVALGLTVIVVGLSKGFVGYRVPGLAIIPLYLLVYVAVAWVSRLRAGVVDDDEPDPDYSDWPTSGPIGHFGQRGLAVPWFTTHLLSILNPRLLVEVGRQIAGQMELESRAKKRGTDGREYVNRGSYTLPFAGEWLLYNGGNTRKTSHSWDVLGQRFALDFVQADASKRRHSGRGTRVEQYSCYGQLILAAAEGTVVSTEDRVRQAPLLGWGVCDFTARSFWGNRVVVEHAPGEFAVYAHLIRGSVRVQPGDTVARGQVLGRCGHTGHSTEPHLHFHLQDSADLYAGMGLPVTFIDLTVDGQPVAAARLTAGDRVAPSAG